MSTSRGTFYDSVDHKFTLEIYEGTGGICLFIKSHTKESLKFWIKEKDRNYISELIGGK